VGYGWMQLFLLAFDVQIEAMRRLATGAAVGPQRVAGETNATANNNLARLGCASKV